MTKGFVPRSLTFQHEREPVLIDADTALTDARLVGRPLILLGEAGSGKSELLRRWAGGPVATAGQVIYGRPPTQGRSFVDGLDETAGLNDGDALDRLLGKLETQQNIDFVIACRIADWRSASGASKIKNWTGLNPVELVLKPLEHDEIIGFLQEIKQLERGDAQTFVAHYEERGLGEWLGNPQTLGMLANVMGDTKRPETTGDLFRLFVEKAWSEHRKQDTPLASASQKETLDALGALFAALIVGGYDALTLAPRASLLRSDLSLAECKALPGITDLSGNQLNAFLGSRLVTRAGNDRFIYLHRRIGEFLGARWLAEQATTDALRKRLLGAFQHGGIVPSSLRGLWGWLADNARIAEDAIRTDPLAVIDYGDADSLTPKYARVLLAAIERVEDEHQSFGWRDYRAAALVQSALSSDVERVLAVPGDKRFWTQFILLRQLRNPEVVARHQETLLEMMLDTTRPYATRDAAADALADHGALNDWPVLLRQLAQSNSHDSLRLVLVIMRNPKVGLTLSDAEFAEAVYAYSGLTQRIAGSREVGTIGPYYYEPNPVIDDDRLDGMLDALSDCARRYRTKKRKANAWEVEHLFFSLLRRRLELKNPDVDRLWEWLSQSNYDRYGGTRDEQKLLNDWLQANDEERRAMQCKVLDSCSAEPRSLRWRLHEIAPGLHPTAEDVVLLLDRLPEADERWSELIWFAPTREEGASAREAATRHVRTEDDLKLLLNHASPPPLLVDTEHRQWEEQNEREQRQRRQTLREEYFPNRQRLRSGAWRALTGPAKVYMGRSYEVDHDLVPEARIGAWIGEDLQSDAIAGFEAFLTADPPQPPSAFEIAKSHAEGRQWHAALILSAALAERQRTGRGFADLSTERLQAGLLAERVAFLDDHTWDSLRDALTVELVHRGTWAETARLFIEPQFQRRSSSVYWLWHVLASADGTVLATEWLRNFPRIAAEPEQELIDHLLRDSGGANREALVEIARRRRKQRLDEPRRRNWQSVEFLLGTISPARLRSTVAGDQGFLWLLRDRMVGRRGGSTINSSPQLLAAIVATFAALWPRTAHPTGVMTGDNNPWDATDFIAGCLDTLAADPSKEATAALYTLANVDYGYGQKINRSTADQRRARANAEWRPANVLELAKLVTDGPPVDHADFQRVVLAELELVQTKIRSSSEDVWRNFYADAEQRIPQTEDRCSDQLVTLLKQSDRSIAFDREKHLGDNREGDIWCTSNGLELAIECKGHWHQDLWTAYNWQLAQQQAVDWRARGYGIYIIYWFGEHSRTVTGPPRGTGIATPKTPTELEDALRNRICDGGLSTITVKVLDFSRSD